MKQVSITFNVPDNFETTSENLAETRRVLLAAAHRYQSNYLTQHDRDHTVIDALLRPEDLINVEAD